MGGVNQALSPLMAHHSRYTEKFKTVSDQRQQMKFFLADANDTLNKIDSSEKLVKAQQVAAEEWTFWGGKKGTYTLEVPYHKSAVTVAVTKNNGFPKGNCVQNSFEWNAKERLTTLSVNCSSGWCRGYEFDLKLLVESKMVHKAKIEELRRELAVKEAEQAQIENEYEELKLENSTVAAEIEVFTRQIEFFNECAHTSGKQTVELGVWKKVAPFYAWAQSLEGQQMFRSAEYADQILMKFYEAFGLKEKHAEAMAKK